IYIIKKVPKKIKIEAYCYISNVKVYTVKVVPIADPRTILYAFDYRRIDSPTKPTTKMFVTVLLCKKIVTIIPLTIPFIRVLVIAAKDCLILEAPTLCSPLLNKWVPYKNIPKPPKKPNIIDTILFPLSI